MTGAWSVQQQAPSAPARQAWPPASNPHFQLAVNTPLGPVGSPAHPPLGQAQPGSARTGPPQQQQQQQQQPAPGTSQQHPLPVNPAAGPTHAAPLEALVRGGIHDPGLAALYEACSGEYEVLMFDIETNGRSPLPLVELAIYAPRTGATFQTLAHLPLTVEVSRPCLVAAAAAVCKQSSL